MSAFVPSSPVCAVALSLMLNLSMFVSDVSARETDNEAFINAMIQYAIALEKRVLIEGRPLTSTELDVARDANVQHPERVRILVLPRIPAPESLFLRYKLKEMGHLQLIDVARGTAKGYGIILTKSGIRRLSVIAHELVHVRQYERLGGIAALMRHHVPDLLANGYHHSALESEAYRRAAEITAGRRKKNNRRSTSD
jgi:hypothetical protein